MCGWRTGCPTSDLGANVLCPIVRSCFCAEVQQWRVARKRLPRTTMSAGYSRVFALWSHYSDAFLVQTGLETSSSLQVLEDFLFNETLRIASPYLQSRGFSDFSHLMEAARNGPHSSAVGVENTWNAMFGEMIGEGITGRYHIYHKIFRAVRSAPADDEQDTYSALLPTMANKV